MLGRREIGGRARGEGRHGDHKGGKERYGYRDRSKVIQRRLG
jgi:hypothetical protein